MKKRLLGSIIGVFLLLIFISGCVYNNYWITKSHGSIESYITPNYKGDKHSKLLVLFYNNNDRFFKQRTEKIISKRLRYEGIKAIIHSKIAPPIKDVTPMSITEAVDNYAITGILVIYLEKISETAVYVPTKIRSVGYGSVNMNIYNNGYWAHGNGSTFTTTTTTIQPEHYEKDYILHYLIMLHDADSGVAEWVADVFIRGRNSNDIIKKLAKKTILTLKKDHKLNIDYKYRKHYRIKKHFE